MLEVETDKVGMDDFLIDFLFETVLETGVGSVDFDKAALSFEMVVGEACVFDVVAGPGQHEIALFRFKRVVAANAFEEIETAS